MTSARPPGLFKPFKWIAVAAFLAGFFGVLATAPPPQTHRIDAAYPQPPSWTGQARLKDI